MKKLLLLIAIVWIGNTAIAQEAETLYLLFEFMHVDNEQESAYGETENFWEKIHEQRIKNGDALGWDLWRITPGGENQGSQYMTVSLYNDPVKMMEGGDFDKAFDGAYPDMSDMDRMKKMEHTSKSRDLTHRVYLQQIATTTPEYEMPIGMVARLNFMKVEPGQADDFEKAEVEVFQPLHQQSVNDGSLANWGLMRNMLGYGSDSYATHMTVDMYSSYDQMFNSGGIVQDPTAAQIKAMDDAMATRDLRSVRIIQLIRKVRP
ncbi:MAG: hypothetical protein WBM43_08470 [Flavobacteriaceae bacterium]